MVIVVTFCIELIDVFLLLMLKKGLETGKRNDKM